MRFSVIFLSVLIIFALASPSLVFALELYDPAQNASNVDYGRESYFRWEEILGAHEYKVTVRGAGNTASLPFTVEPGACSGGTCAVWFLDEVVTRVVTIQPLSSYSWWIIAEDAFNNPIETSRTSTFTTKPRDVSGGPGVGAGRPVVTTPPPAFPLQNPISSQTLPQLLENVLNFLFGLSIVILPIVIVYGGILLLGSGGDPEKVSRGRAILLWAVIAFAIILLARGLPAVLRALL